MRKAGTLLILSLAINPTLGGSTGAKEPPMWNRQMRELEQKLQELLVDVSSDEQFNSPKNRSRIEKNAERFSKLAHSIKAQKTPNSDPDATMEIIGGQFAAEAEYAYRILKSGHRAYARGILRSMATYCIACHTRNGSGPNFRNDSPLLPGLGGLRPLEKANFLAASRQFDRALSEYERLVNDPKFAESQPFDWERAIRSSLAIAVRVKQDPDRALSLVESILSAPRGAFYLKEDAQQWKKSIIAWKAEPVQSPKTESGYYARAVKLVETAKTQQKFPMDRSADILYLRASSAIHELLTFAPRGEHVADAFYLAGVCYEVLRDLNVLDQHEYYYLACILKAPHTPRAQECFRSYEQSVYMGFTGSGGTNLPGEVRKKLIELGELAAPQSSPKPLQ